MPKQQLQLTWDINYAIKESAAPKELILLLHGWQQRGDMILDELGSCFGPDALVIAPDGPFPAPYPGRLGFRAGFGWYLFDQRNNSYLVPMDFAVHYLTELVNKLGLDHLPKRVVGFSQGGYLAPFAALGLAEVQQVLVINARYRSEVLVTPLPFRADAVTVLDDPMVEAERARTCHAELMSFGNRGTFKTLPVGGHMVTEGLRVAVQEMLKD